MRAALVVGDSRKLCGDLKTHMTSLGYMTVATEKHDAALSAVGATQFDVVLICSPTRPVERRSFAGELKSRCHTAAVILITASDATYAAAKACQFAGITAVIKGPVSLVALWRVIEFGLEGLGCHRGWVDETDDRRRARAQAERL
ncbi:hypothetical protein SOM61_19305 [Massilia sp. CFBP9012]|uniref:hypothetical protein n=1 Tax=Massilia sp. CFBP9012 TaxID=3096531 RepID=UPI002A6AA607|nr:hypothetical protein [Massilia sp. CFBP9012]MDY0977117.1 hypothetical protein [Massilia sp. CFBP9012]